MGGERGTGGGVPRGVARGDGVGKFAGSVFGGGRSGTGVASLCGTRPGSPTTSGGRKRVHPGNARVASVGVWHATEAVTAPITPRGADSWAAQWLVAQLSAPEPCGPEGTRPPSPVEYLSGLYSFSEGGGMIFRRRYVRATSPATM